MTSIYTIGYEGLTVDSWIAKLSKEGINLIIDVREKPLSRKKGFSKTSMTNLVESYNMGYVHIRELGSPCELRQELHKTGNYITFFKKYQDYLSKKQNILDYVLAISSGKKVCLVCYENNAFRCHRSVIAENILMNNPRKVKVRHL